MSLHTFLDIIIPMKPTYEGKSRLANVLSADARAALCLMLLQDVLRTLNCIDTCHQTLVLGGDEWVRSVSARESANWEADPGGGLNAALKYAAENAYQKGAKAILILPADLGLLTASDVDSLVEISAGLTNAVLTQADSDGGTNALLAPTGMLIPPTFGPKSMARHLQLAWEAGIPVKVAPTSSLSFDLDAPKDLRRYLNEKPDSRRSLLEWTKNLCQGSYPAMCRTNEGSQ